MKPKSIKQAELRRVLHENGFELVRQGKHLIFKNDKGDTISLSSNPHVSQKTLLRELKNVGIDWKEIL